MDTSFYCVDYYSNQSCLVFLVLNVLKMRFPTICVTYKVGMNTINFCYIKNGWRRNFTRSCDGSRAIFLVTSLLGAIETRFWPSIDGEFIVVTNTLLIRCIAWGIFFMKVITTKFCSHIQNSVLT